MLPGELLVFVTAACVAVVVFPLLVPLPEAAAALPDAAALPFFPGAAMLSE
jgi:hypothetical protein